MIYAFYESNIIQEGQIKHLAGIPLQFWPFQLTHVAQMFAKGILTELYVLFIVPLNKPNSSMMVLI